VSLQFLAQQSAAVAVEQAEKVVVMLQILVEEAEAFPKVQCRSLQVKNS
jgi:hypothetical protein